MSPAADSVPPVADPGERSLDPDWRPAQLTDVCTVVGIKKIMAWFGEMWRYEAAAKPAYESPNLDLKPKAK